MSAAPPPVAGGSPDDAHRPDDPTGTESASTQHASRPGESMPAQESAGWRVGSLWGIPVYIGGGWLVIGVVMVAIFGPQVAATLPDLGLWSYVVALGYAMLLLVSVLVHEAAHALTALRCGFRVHRIAADLMGGHTAYDAARATPGASALVALAGPAANGLLCVLGWQALPYMRGDVAGLLLGAVAWTNGFVAIFNLLPGLPLDGGYLLDALVWKVTGRRHVGLIAAGWSGRIVTILVVVWFAGTPLLRGEAPSLFTVAWIALVGAFLWFGAGQAIATGRMRGRLAALDVRSVVHPVVTIRADAPLSALPQVAADVAARGLVVAVIEAGDPIGVLDGDAVEQAAQADAFDTVPAAACLRVMPDGWVLVLPRGSADLRPAVDALVERQVPLLLLADPDGSPWGALDAATIGRIAAGEGPPSRRAS